MFRRGVIYFHAGARPQGAQRFVTPNHDFVAVFHSAGDFHVRNARDSRFTGTKSAFLP